MVSRRLDFEGIVDVGLIRELPVNSLPILIIIIDTDFTDLHRRYGPKKLLSFYGFIESKLKNQDTTLNLC